MKFANLWMSSVLLFTLASCGGVLKETGKIKEPVTLVYKEGHTIYYSGPLTAAANQLVKSYIDRSTTKLVINSSGGEINLGMDLGELVFNNSLDVGVTEFCFSSCANYVFPAGKHKILESTSLVGWHGGATQSMEMPKDPEMQRALKEYMKNAIKRETAYFQSIGVSQQVTVYGLRPEFSKSKCVGWTYSIEAMQQFGIKNITINSGIWSPPSIRENKCIFKIDKINLEKQELRDINPAIR